MKKILFVLLIAVTFLQIPYAQNGQKEVSQMSKDDVLELTYDELLEMPFEDVMKLAEIAGVSLDELYEMLLNKDVVSASKKVESSFVAPLSTSVISYDEIISSGARTVEEALRLVPGMIVREKTNGNFDVHIRGNDNTPANHMLVYSENSITLVMIDGRPVYNYVHGGTFWETLPIGFDDIDRIEVVRGPSSALYGPNAVSGVVNIITKKVNEKKMSAHANAQIGTQSTIISSFGVSKKLSDKFAAGFTGNFETMQRNTDLLYVHKANGGEGGFITKEELATLNDPFNPGYKVFDPHDDVDEMYPDPKNSRQRFGVNGYLAYNASEDINFDLKGGYQASEVLSTTMGDNPSSLVGRLSNTAYTDLNLKIHGLRGQVNYLSGVQDIVRADTGFKVDIMNINANFEYDFNFGNLNVRPGVTYMQGDYNDLPYLRYVGQGFLNGKRTISSIAGSLRLDYLAYGKLRFVGAVRAEKYNTQDNLYFSYQFITSYNLNDKHNFRFVASKANRGPFLVDSYANYLWDREGRPSPSSILFKGKENGQLLTMNMLELGYRVKPAKNIMVDLEGFLLKTKNFGALYPDSLERMGLDANNARMYFVRMSFSNIDLESQQLGLTGSASWVINKNMFLKIYGTYQISQLKNSIVYLQDQTIQNMIIDLNNYRAKIDSTFTTWTTFRNITEDIENKATPSFYGGFIFNYTFKEKLNFNLNSYYYTQEEFNSKYSINGPDNLEPKLAMNVKISYEIIKNFDIYINTRNILGKKQEFAYTDEIGTLVLLGLSFNY